MNCRIGSVLAGAATGMLALIAFASPVRAISARLLVALNGEAPTDFFGSSVAGAGDVNGDGFADFIVGAPLDSTAGHEAGRAYVYFGGPTADAIADITFTGEVDLDFLGVSVAGAGDVNGDGFDDLIVGAFRAGERAGRAYVYFGGPAADATADLTLAGEAADDGFGISVAGAGDVNGDGFADVIVGAYKNATPYPPPPTEPGRAYVYFGGPAADTLADLTFTGEAPGDRFGVSVASAGDVNGDGFDDVIVGASAFGYGQPQYAYVYFGGPAADATTDLTFTGEVANSSFGNSVAGAGDVNGDGFADLIVGAAAHPAAGDRTGRAYVYFGGPAADVNADLTFTGQAAGDLLGGSVAGVGDVNGDGFADLMVGAYGSGGKTGSAYVYFGGRDADATADLTLTGEATGDEFGQSVAGAGDVNGDGLADLIVGTLYASRAYVYVIDVPTPLPAGGTVSLLLLLLALAGAGLSPVIERFPPRNAIRPNHPEGRSHAPRT